MTVSKRRAPAWLVLTIIALAAGLILAFTYELTKDRIAQTELETLAQARRQVLAQADSFEEIDCPDGFESVYRGMKDGECAGYVLSATYNGYSSPMLLTLGVDMNGMITGLNVGGSGFAETAGLGAKAKDPAFMEQFAGKTGEVVLNGKDDNGVDAISGATVTSTGVVNGVNELYAYAVKLINE